MSKKHQDKKPKQEKPGKTPSSYQAEKGSKPEAKAAEPVKPAKKK